MFKHCNKDALIRPTHLTDDNMIFGNALCTIDTKFIMLLWTICQYMVGC